MDNEKAVADATVNKLNAEADKLRGDTKDPGVTKQQQRLDLDWALVKKQREEIQKSIDEINSEYQRAVNVHIPADTRSAFPVISVQSPVSIQCCWQS